MMSGAPLDDEWALGVERSACLLMMMMNGALDDEWSV